MRQHVSKHDMNNFLNTVSKLPQSSNEQSMECKITVKELFEALNSMPKEKSPWNDGLLYNFSKCFGLSYFTYFW